MLVMHVVDRLSGGVPIAVRSYISNTSEQFSHVVVAPFVDGAPSRVWEGLDASYFDLTASRFSQMSAIRAAIRSTAPDVVHAHSSFPGALTRIPGLSRARIIYSPHCFKFDDPGTGRVTRALFRLVERMLAHRTAGYAVLSGHEAALAAGLGRSVNVHRVPNVPSVPLRSTAPPPRRKIGMIGRIAPQKDPSFMAELTRTLTSSDRIEAVWIGDGERHALLHAAGVRVTGWLDETDLLAEIDDLGVYVHTASYEGFPLSVLDAAARRIPIIVRRIPALQEAGLATFDTPAEAASLATRACIDSAFREELRAAGDRLLHVMNPATQREALVEIWSDRGSGQVHN